MRFIKSHYLMECRKTSEIAIDVTEDIGISLWYFNIFMQQESYL